MPESCRVNPIQRFISKRDNVSVSSLPTLISSSHVHSSSSSSRSLERTFLQGHVPSLVTRQPLISDNKYSPPYVPDEASRSNTIGSSHSETWINQFSAMKVEDPLEASLEYKRLYKNYERQMGNGYRRFNSSSPDLKPQFVSPVGQRIQKSRLLKRGGTVPLSGSRASPYGTIQTHSTTTHTPTDALLEAEFNTLEQELMEQDLATPETRETSNPAFTGEQRELQEIASSIVDACSPPLTPLARDSPVQSKLASSKFMGLMKRVSDGDVTVKPAQRELFTPGTGDRVGSEYFQVGNGQHDPTKK
ncbi:Pex21p KNAG_0K00570 [Huiozyma naganishii CBS 8797]|uniref:PEX18/PEX21 C-terminal domain-containing protein n=1 Tax=Huiozyma naganishii (strain ATCC MYA-139 / BCRC 22969 / CBS 8797 / KCTC 17520 / NBRC 10181 / NCYC 3082 / Yp74L-3) TaxID=1071383 RepID=J7RBZ9_HUIN7|nr:hypothetical protein KNAG_0K00570 [Kazachstania naganishii CBS 8797]CCK72425.1 hypothetical protein KNAG_0K00570 [Kazachstania naganishii CBS 8797]